MSLTTHTVWRSITAALLSAAAFSLTASAQDCGLSLRAGPRVLLPGQVARVWVDSSTPATAYAFASADFDLLADLPQWSAASSGAMLGNTVLGATASQPHAPQIGVLADPSDPLAIWKGAYQPVSYDPAFVRLGASPTDFRVYPSPLTGSAIPCDATGDQEWLMINPIMVGEHGVASGVGPGRDRIDVSGRLVSVESPDSAILIGLLLPAIQNVHDSEIRLRFDGLPTSLKLRGHTTGGMLPSEEITMGYTKAEWVYRVGHPDLPLGVSLQIQFMLDGKALMTQESDPALPERDMYLVERIPDTFATIGSPTWPRGGSEGTKSPRPELQPDELSCTLVCGFDAPVMVRLRSGEVMLVDRIETRANFPRTSNNIRQLAIAMHSYEASGVRAMTVELPER